MVVGPAFFNVGVHQIETVDITFSAQIAGLIEEEILDVLVGHAAAGIGVVGHHAVPLAVFDFYRTAVVAGKDRPVVAAIGVTPFEVAIFKVQRAAFKVEQTIVGIGQLFGFIAKAAVVERTIAEGRGVHP